MGGAIGHSLCTGLAIIAGRFIAQRVSPKNVTIVGGVVFLLFAISAFVICSYK
jgi:putative Ca2+/H+ antiporter (TMEM165/GDT1 family)